MLEITVACMGSVGEFAETSQVQTDLLIKPKTRYFLKPMLADVVILIQMDLKSKNIASLGNDVSNIDREINLINENSNFMKKIVFYNGSGEKGEITVWKNLDQPLKEFLLDFFKKEKQLVYDEISKELQSDNNR